MTEERAIDRCNELIKSKHANWIGLSNQNAIETVLNMIKEKDKKIERLKKENEHWKNGFERELEDNRENTGELLKQDLIIRKKDKQIDLMAEYIFESIDVEEDICNSAYVECKQEIAQDITCIKCIKQYSKSKAEKE